MPAPLFTTSLTTSLATSLTTSLITSCMAALAIGTATPALAADSSLAQQLAHWSREAGAPGDAARGEAFFNARHGGRWSCASCHGARPTTPGKHADTGKRIDPLTPATHAAAFTDVARSDKWFRRNCNDVLSRACSPAEKADVLAWLAGLK